MADIHTLKVEKLTRAAFAEFGDVIQVDDQATRYVINGGNTDRYHDLANIDVGPAGKAIVSIFRGKARDIPFQVTMMERHPLGSQAFIPLSSEPYLVVVAPKNAQPVVGDIRCFLAQPNQGVNYAAGVWHHPLLALKKTCDFLVVDRSGDGANCDEVSLSTPGVISSIY
jgi:ureidoglycolate lyase